MLTLRSDAGPERGTGHVMRCLAIAEAWTDQGYGTAHFVCAELPDQLRARVERRGHEITELNVATGSEADLRRTSELAERSHATVLDGYHLSPDYLRAITGMGSTTLYIDDFLHQDAYPVDVILHPISGRSEAGFPGKLDHTRCLVGPDYLLLRSEFDPYRNWDRTHPDQPGRLLVSMGGADPDNVTRWVLDALHPGLQSDIHLDVVVGSVNPHESSLRSRLSEFSVSWELHAGVDRIADLMADVDLAVSAGGTMAWELAYMQIPSVIVPIAENQRLIAECLERTGAAVDMGINRASSASKLQKVYRTLIEDPARREQMGTQGRDVVDGYGTERVVEELRSA